MDPLISSEDAPLKPTSPKKLADDVPSNVVEPPLIVAPFLKYMVEEVHEMDPSTVGLLVIFNVLPVVSVTPARLTLALMMFPVEEEASDNPLTSVVLALKVPLEPVSDRPLIVLVTEPLKLTVEEAEAVMELTEAVLENDAEDPVSVMADTVADAENDA